MLDFFNIESLLTEEERAVRDSVRRFVDEKVLPIIGDCFDKGEFPRHLIPEMAEMGLLGSSLPTEYGCARVGNRTDARDVTAATGVARSASPFTSMRASFACRR